MTLKAYKLFNFKFIDSFHRCSIAHGWSLYECKDREDILRGAVVRPGGVLVLQHLPPLPRLPPPPTLLLSHQERPHCEVSLKRNSIEQKYLKRMT